LSGGPRWAPLPPGSTRWLLPTHPSRAASSSLHIYHPVTINGLIGWEAARAFASVGGFRLLPGHGAVPEEVTELLAVNRVAYRSLAVARANHPSRFLALLLNDSFSVAGVAKMAFDDRGRHALRQEAHAIESAGIALPSPVRPPRVHAAAEGLLLLEPVAWLPRVTSWRLPGEVAYSVGAYSTRNGTATTDAGAAHGDFAPWNLLRTKDGWVLLDWEHASSKPPFFDLWHYLLQAHSLLGRPNARTLLNGVREGRGWVGIALAQYARGCDRSPDEAVKHLDAYISASAEQLAGRSHREQQGLKARNDLQRLIIGGRG
jgi:Phosphotransferase enzyme family